MNTSNPHPFEFMHEVNREFVNRKKDFKLLSDFYNQQKNKMANAFVDFDFINSNIIFRNNLVRPNKKMYSHGGGLLDDKNITREIFSLAMFATWRIKPNIYHIDPHLYKQVINSKIPFDSPSTIFNNLPFWSIYIKLEDHTVELSDENNELNSLNCFGFWAYKAYYNDQLCLCIYPHIKEIDKTNNIKSFIPPFFLFIDENFTIEQGLTEYFDKYVTNKNTISSESHTQHLEEARLYLSLLLFLCIEEPQISTADDNDVDLEVLKALPKVHPKTQKFIPPQKPTELFVGKRLGGEIRDFIRSEKNYQESGKTVKPHIRQAHWHTYWYGKEPNKTFKLKFLPPIFVNFKNE